MKTFFEPQNEDEQTQLEWMLRHPIQDKDFIQNELEAAEQANAQRLKKEIKYRKSPASWNMPIPEQEIDLHGYTADEAGAALEEMFEAMTQAGMSVLRIVHGGGNPAYGNVKRLIDRKARSEWKNKILFYKTEPDNAGSSILKLASTPQSAKISPRILKNQK